METPIFGVLVYASFGMLILVSGGIAYLTLAEWRDLRRQERDQKGEPTLKKSTQKSERTPKKSKRSR